MAKILIVDDDSAVQTTIRLDRDVFDHFRASGRGWQSRMNDTLRRAVDRERKRAKS